MSIKNMFKYFIKVKFLGLMYGSLGVFLLLENLVGCFWVKFFFDVVIFLGLILSVKCYNN